jgi:hypothetical protein
MGRLKRPGLYLGWKGRRASSIVYDTACRGQVQDIRGRLALNPIIVDRGGDSRGGDGGGDVGGVCYQHRLERALETHRTVLKFCLSQLS